MIAQKPNSEQAVKAGPVAIIAPLPPPYGGMALQARALARHLSAEGISVVVVPTNPKLPKLIAKVIGIRTLLQTGAYFFRLTQAVSQVTVVHVLAASYFYFFARVAPAILLARLFGRRVILNYRGGEAPRFLSSYGFFLKPLFRLASTITVPSAFLKQTFLRHQLPATIVPNPIDLNRFRYRDRERLRPRLLVCRNLERMYNIHMALRAYEIVKHDYPEARLDIVGSGAEEASLTDWVRGKGLQGVVFHGAVSHQRMPEFLSAADILLNPTDVDNLPMSMLEAFACGVAVVSTNVGGIPDMLEDSRSALLVPPDDHREMASKIMELLRNDQLARRTILAARDLAENYCWKAVRNQLLQAYYPDRQLIAKTQAVKSELS
jgi:glycosyltransferase involved in cell wall biosynthesis